MINLDEYKYLLVNAYKHEIDNNEDKRQIRRSILVRDYSDEYLNKIINDTYEIAKKILECDDCRYFEIKLEEDTTTYISLDLTGGWFSDRLYVDPCGNIISEYILDRIFGKNLVVELRIDENEFYDEDEDFDIVGVDYNYFLYIQGFPENMKNIKEEIFVFAKTMNLNK